MTLTQSAMVVGRLGPPEAIASPIQIPKHSASTTVAGGGRRPAGVI